MIFGIGKNGGVTVYEITLQFVKSREISVIAEKQLQNLNRIALLDGQSHLFFISFNCIYNNTVVTACIYHIVAIVLAS